MRWLAYSGSLADVFLLVALWASAGIILIKGLINNFRGKAHGLVTLCFALALACLAFGVMRGAVATISAVDRTEKGFAECYIPALLFLGPIVGYGGAAVTFSVIAGLLSTTRRKRE